MNYFMLHNLSLENNYKIHNRLSEFFYPLIFEMCRRKTSCFKLIIEMRYITMNWAEMQFHSKSFRYKSAIPFFQFLSNKILTQS
jgi:hypothetical protein